MYTLVHTSPLPNRHTLFIWNASEFPLPVLRCTLSLGCGQDRGCPNTPCPCSICCAIEMICRRCSTPLAHAPSAAQEIWCRTPHSFLTLMLTLYLLCRRDDAEPLVPWPSARALPCKGRPSCCGRCRCCLIRGLTRACWLLVRKPCWYCPNILHALINRFMSHTG